MAQAAARARAPRSGRAAWLSRPPCGRPRGTAGATARADETQIAAHLVAATLVETDIRRFELPVATPGAARHGCNAVAGGDGVFEGRPVVRVWRRPSASTCVTRALHVLCDACGQSGRLDQTRCRACRTTKADPMRLVVDDPTATLALASA